MAGWRNFPLRLPPFGLDVGDFWLYAIRTMTDKCAIFICGLLAVALTGPVRAQGTEAGDSIKEELEYIRLLQEMRMPDIAEEVIGDLKTKHPGAIAQLKVAEIQGQLSLGKFDEVQKVIDAIPDKKGLEFWALTIAKADAYYAYQQYKEVDKLYLAFFSQFKDPKVKVPDAFVTFYRDTAYKYAQILLGTGRDKDALQAFERLSKIALEESLARQVLSDKAELCLKLASLESNAKAKAEYLKRADAYADKLLWNQDVFFGKAIVFKMHIATLRGDVKTAQELEETYMPQLKLIHDALRKEEEAGGEGLLRMSPMPQCRYLLGTIREAQAYEEAKKSKPDEEFIKSMILGERDPATKKRNGKGAYQHFLNVFVRFPESQWASDCGQHAEELRAFVKERYGADLPAKVTAEQMAKVRRMQFADAAQTFGQNQFGAAIEKYEKILAQFPEADESVPALGDLAICYIEDGAAKDWYKALAADTVAAHLADRFCKNPRLTKAAGDQLRRVAEHYGQNGQPEKQNETYELFFRNFPEHHAAGALVMSFGEREFTAKNFPAAMRYYRTISEVYTNSVYYYDALNRIAQIYKEEGDFPKAIEATGEYVTKVARRPDPGHALILGLFKLAETQREYGDSFFKAADTNETLSAEEKTALQAEGQSWLVKAVKGFNAVNNQLANPTKYQRNAEEAERNKLLRETAAFTTPLCLVRLKSPKPEVQKALRTQAIKSFEKYVEQFPEGKYAAKSLLQVGTLYTVNEDVENAQKALDRLAKDYPDSEEAKNSVPMLAETLIEMGLRGEGVAKYRQMFAAGGKYTDREFLKAGEALENAREYDMAIQAYDKAASVTKEVSYKARAAIGRARSLYGLKRYTDAHKAIDSFLQDKALSKTQQLVDANLLLVDVASEEGKTEKNDKVRVSLFNNAVDALMTVRAYRRPRDEKGKELPAAKWTVPQRVADAELRLKSAEVVLRRLDAENKMGLKEQAAKTRGEAIVALQGMLMSLNTQDSALAPVVEKVSFDCIPLLLDHKKNKDAEEDCQTYLRLFPDGKYKNDVQTWLNQAKIQ